MRRLADEESGRAQAMGIDIVGLDDARYPSSLRQIFDPPAVLFVRGKLFADLGRAIAIVGARAASASGLGLATQMAKDLARGGSVVVSGLARGIDTAAHRGALDAGGTTLAVLGSGLANIYPPENLDLVARIAERGAVVSEFGLDVRPEPRHFPRRNRIIAGLCAGLVVVEAGRKSGSLITAHAALEAGREVMGVPGHPGSSLSAGTNALIRDGARLVRDAADVALELGIDLPLSTPPEGARGGPQGLLASLEVDKPATLEEIQARSGRALAQLLAELTELELASQVRRLPGSMFVRN